jgi:peptidoglycan/LPS O-acetylase OafA/YrhL
METARCQAGRNLYVDRLRGLASLSVVLSHASGYGFINIMLYMVPHHVLISIAANAYHGVTLFFVISGFLITTKILNVGDEAGHFSLCSFYRDRVARIAPCLILMLVAACGLAAMGHSSVPCGLVRNTFSALGCVHLSLQRLDTNSSNAAIVGSTLVLVDRGGILPQNVCFIPQRDK